MGLAAALPQNQNKPIKDDLDDTFSMLNTLPSSIRNEPNTNASTTNKVHGTNVHDNMNTTSTAPPYSNSTNSPVPPPPAAPSTPSPAPSSSQPNDGERQKLDILDKLVLNVKEMSETGKYSMSDIKMKIKNKSDLTDTRQRLLEFGEYLTQQMLKADGVESDGNQTIRLKRKDVVKRILDLTDEVEMLNKQISSLL